MAWAVRWAARTPASRATSVPPPLRSRPARTRRMAAGEIRMRPRATASRAVTSLADTSTMSACPSRSRWLRARARDAGPEGRARSAFEGRAIPLEEVAEEDRRRSLAGLGGGAVGVDDHERIRAGVGHEVGRAHRTQGPGHQPAPLETHARWQVGFAAGAVLDAVLELHLDHGPGDRLRPLHAKKSRPREQVEGDLGGDRVAGEAEHEGVAPAAEDERRPGLDRDLGEEQDRKSVV